jgi:hypothetical protein
VKIRIPDDDFGQWYIIAMIWLAVFALVAVFH